MPNPIKPLRSHTAGRIPTAEEMEANELAINWADGKLFTKHPTSGAIVAIVAGGGGGGGSGEDSLLRSLFLPGAPTSVTASAGSGQATVSWTAPANVIAQAPVTDYVVQYSDDAASTWTTFSDGTSASTSATVTGLTNGEEYTFRVAAVNAIGQGDWSAASGAVTPAGDPYFSSVSLLLHMDGSGSTFVDSSSNARTVTAYGDATQSTAQSKFGGKAAYFDGSGDYLSLGENAAFTQWGDENWTVELWFRAASVSAYGPLFSASGRMNLHILSQRMYLNNAVDGVGGILTSEVLSANTWHHVVAVRSGSTCSLYVDGTLAASGDVPFGTGPGALNIGGDASNSFSGYIDEVRHTRGVARYSGSSITVPTAAFPNA